MCYSAQLEEAYRAYLRMTGAEMDLSQFMEIYGARADGAAVRIPRGFDRNFANPATPQELAIKGFIDRYRANAIAALEREIFAQRKRLADADRKLAAKETKVALESRRIATQKVQAALQRLPLFKSDQPHPADGRLFPQWYAPIVVKEAGRNLLKLARYHCRQAGKPAGIDRQFPGLYTARRDNLEKFWRNEFRHSHAVMLVHSFYENVERDGRNLVLHFVPRPAEVMLVACLYSRWVDPQNGTELLSFAAITDEPPAEVAAAGHDRMIVSIKAENVEHWLAPQERSVEELQAILGDRQSPYYAHQVLAA
jgi:putative SOS response-associated peptidase YedK